MTSVQVGLIGIGALFLLFALRMPVAFAMAVVGFAGFAYLTSFSAAASLLARDFFSQFSSYGLSAITMFVLMGSYALMAGLGERLYRAAYSLAGRLPGGLGISTVLACAGFAAISGSTTATAATMGKIALPEMEKYGYDRMLASGAVAAAGTLGILIPPSTVFLLYAFLTQQPIGELFAAGIVPGLILTALFALTVYLMCRIRPELGPRAQPVPWRERLKAGAGAWQVAVLFLVVVGGMFYGWFSPTQAGAIGSAGAILVGIANRRISWRAFVEGTRDGLRTSVMILSLIAGATVFGRFMAVTRIPFLIAGWVESLPLSPDAILVVIALIFFVGGFFMDSMALVTLLVPVVFPVVQRLGFDPVWFGVIVVITAEMGVITPPVGVNVYVIKGIAPHIPLESIFRGIMPYLASLFVVIGLLLAYPQLALWLPGLGR
ncbi:MAG: TRAP transporter large permease [Firmicutes bacterium]|nr:TRAP transporter large permease [Bacillota bacterium]